MIDIQWIEEGRRLRLGDREYVLVDDPMTFDEYWDHIHLPSDGHYVPMYDAAKRAWNTLFPVVGAAQRLIDRLEDAHKRGETFPLDVAVGAARLQDALAALDEK